MRIAVLVKAVGPPPIPGPTDAGIDVLRMNPADEFALEAALRLKDIEGDIEITLVCFGAAEATTILARGIAMGANGALLLVDECDGNPDPWATASALAQHLRDTPFDLIICGRQSRDMNAGLVGPYVAEILGRPHMSRALSIELKPGAANIVVERKLERGNREVLACPLPALVAMETDINVPRYPTLRALLAAPKQIQTVTFDAAAGTELRASSETDHTEPNFTKTVSITRPRPRQNREKSADAVLTAAERMQLMMKGGDAGGGSTSNSAKSKDALLEGTSNAVLDELQQLMARCGVRFDADRIKLENS